MYNPENETRKSETRSLNSYTYAGRWVTDEVSKNKFPEKSMDSRAAYQLIHDEMNLDGNPALNLASFVTTWMEDEAQKIIMESLNKNYIDTDEYPQTQIIHDRLMKMMGNLFHSDIEKNYADENFDNCDFPLQPTNKSKLILRFNCYFFSKELLTNWFDFNDNSVTPISVNRL